MEKIRGKGKFSAWNEIGPSECVMEGESGEQVGGELRECDIISRVLYTRLTERDRKLIPEMR